MKYFAKKILSALVSTGLIVSMSLAAQAQELSFMLNSDGKEVEVLQDFIDRYEQANPGVSIKMNVVGYNVI